MDPLTIALISGLVQGGVAAYRNVKASKGLAALEKQRLPSYMDAAAPIQENKQMYSQMARTGMGPASLNLARNQFAAGQNALAAAPAGGQLRTQIGRLASANAGGFANQLAAQNEAIRRQGMAGVAQANLGLSGLQQRDVGVALQRRTEAERAYGQAIQDSRREMLGALAGVGTAAIGQQQFGKQMDYYNRQLDMYGKYMQGQNGTNNINPNYGKTPSTFPGLVQSPGTFPPSAISESFVPISEAERNRVQLEQDRMRDINNRTVYVRQYPLNSQDPLAGFQPIGAPGTFTPNFMMGAPGSFRPNFMMGAPSTFTPSFMMGAPRTFGLPGSFRTPSSLPGSYYNPSARDLYNPEFIESKG